ncbi:hypothetical protein SPAN111604_04385 [Sphingomonas antarctica]|uniref:PilZ domain-containing protein n=1 Tax=Sphingomonas antarctica TaxID=2040274 RepID=UPI0039E93974
MSAIQVNREEMIVSSVERRSDDNRYVSIFRTGRISRVGGEELCVLRNISTGGAMIAHNGDLDIGERVTLDLRLDESLVATVVWVKGERSGLQFDTEADLPKILAGHTAGPRPRPPRLRIAAIVGVTAGQTRARVTLRDISQTGACFEEGKLPRVPELRVVLDGLGDYRAIVCWRRGGLIGVNFASTLPMWPLNDWVRSAR